MNQPPIRRVRGLNEPPAAPEVVDKPSLGATSPAAKPVSRAARREADDEAPTRRIEDVDSDLDRALDAQIKSRTAPDYDDDEQNFKRKKDDDVEAELESLLAGFDPETLTQSGPRTRSRDREGQPKEGVGQENRHGLQRAKVVGIKSGTVFLDLNAKSEGIVPLEQFEESPPNIGDVVEVIFDHYDREEGLLVMSRRGAAVIATWDNLKQGLIVEARVTKEIKGGVEVEVNGIRGFLPISQIELGRVEDIKPYINQKLKCLVTEANQRERNLVVSRRDLLEKERAEQREKTWATLEVGQTRTGVVRNIKEFGAFVDLGGVDGLILVSNLVWGRVKHPSEVVSLGHEVEVKVLHIDREKQKVSLGLKQLKKSPWDDIEDRFDIGQIVKGTVTRLMEFGAFVEIEPGIEGLIHISEMGPKKVWRPKDVVSEGEEVEVRILKLDPDEKRISLSLKPLPAAAKTEEDEPAEGDPASAPRPERKVPLKGGLGERDANPFAQMPK
jgi:small subunit ribosomal protein S1